jgi:transposase InsO family protein
LRFLRSENDTTECFELIEALKTGFPVSWMCQVLGVDRRRYHEWENRDRKQPTARGVRMDKLITAVKESHVASDGTYGAPRIHADLVAAGWQVSLKSVAKAMRVAGIEGISPRTWHPVTTVRGPDAAPAPDRVARRFDQGGKDIAWFSDITYLAYGKHWAYLCAVRDGHTRRVLGRVVADNMRAGIVESAIRQAVALRGDLPGKIIFHADRGSQFTSRQIAELAASLPILRSMGRTGVCWDNAQAESFWSTFKNEYYYRHVFTSLEQLRRGTYVWIDSWYNAKRRHSALGYLSPLEYERHLAGQVPPN